MTVATDDPAIVRDQVVFLSTARTGWHLALDVLTCLAVDGWHSVDDLLSAEWMCRLRYWVTVDVLDLVEQPGHAHLTFTTLPFSTETLAYQV